MKECNDFWEEEYLGDSEVWTISIYPRKGGCETVGITPSFKEALDAVITLATDKIADGWSDGAYCLLQNARIRLNMMFFYDGVIKHTPTHKEHAVRDFCGLCEWIEENDQ